MQLKKIKLSGISLFFLLICAGTFTQAQSPRLQLFEYFENTSIPPNIGALARTRYDLLAAANPDKLITLQYHVAWGSETGTDPLNLHNPAQVQARVTYYTVTGDPHGIQDGGDSTLGVFRGQPANFEQTFIDARDSAASPFTIVVSHSLNQAHDSIRCHAVITRTGTTTGSLKAHVAVIEKNIRFNMAPGISGQTLFNNVMKRMLPTESGTTLSAMNIGDSVVLDLKWKLANVYDTTQLAVICFVQNSTTREVYQAGYSAPHLQMNDAAVASIGSVADFSCDSITPDVILQNAGTNALLSCTINYQLDNGTPASVPWSGNLAPGASASVTLPSLYASGYHLLKVFPTNPNGTPDPVRFNDTIITFFSNASTPASDSIAEGFEGTFSPADWGIANPQRNGTWKQASVGGFGNSANSIALGWYTLPAGNTDDLYAPALDLASANSATLEFDVAYARYDGNSPDTLQVRVSADCGITWTTVFEKTSTALATAPDTTEEFIPTSTQWRHESVNLNAFTGEANVQVQFHGICMYGNNVYLDDIHIRFANNTGIGHAASNRIEVYPNPFSGELTFRTSNSEPLEVILYDLSSKTLVRQKFSALVCISTEFFSPGIYLYEIRNESGVIEKGKVVKE